MDSWRPILRAYVQSVAPIVTALHAFGKAVQLLIKAVSCFSDRTALTDGNEVVLKLLAKNAAATNSDKVIAAMFGWWLRS